MIDNTTLCIVFRKTTVAKILRQVLQKIKAVSSSKFSEISARELQSDKDVVTMFKNNKNGNNFFLCLLFVFFVDVPACVQV